MFHILELTFHFLVVELKFPLPRRYQIVTNAVPSRIRSLRRKIKATRWNEIINQAQADPGDRKRL
jgi:hypothetical protein